MGDGLLALRHPPGDDPLGDGQGMVAGPIAGVRLGRARSPGLRASRLRAKNDDAPAAPVSWRPSEGSKTAIRCRTAQGSTRDPGRLGLVRLEDRDRLARRRPRRPPGRRQRLEPAR